MNKKTLTVLFLGCAVMLFIAGCSKKPEQEIKDAKAALDAVVMEGAEKYAKEDLKLLNDSLNNAMNEIETQDKKFLKDYGKTKEMLAQVMSDAQNLKVNLPVIKEKTKNDALAAHGAAKIAIEESKKLLAKAPAGKGSKSDIEALKADIAGLETSLTEVQTLIENEEYFATLEKSDAISDAIKEKAAEISEQIRQALEKVEKKK